MHERTCRRRCGGLRDGLLPFMPSLPIRVITEEEAIPGLASGPGGESWQNAGGDRIAAAAAAVP